MGILKNVEAAWEERQGMYKFNVYLASKRWLFMEEIWSGVDRKLPVGGIELCRAGTLYDKAVYLKRMT
jgi:hypothetical protein